MTITDPQPVFLDKLDQLRDDTQAVREWFARHPEVVSVARLTPYFGIAAGTSSLPEINIMVGTPEALATCARALADGAPIGAVVKTFEDGYARVRRSFGLVSVEAWAERADVCERVVTGTETVVTTALACVHCGQAIFESSHGHWWHMRDGVKYGACSEDTDTSATPPDFGAVEVEEVEQVEWVCSPLLNSDAHPELHPSNATPGPAADVDSPEPF